MVHRACSIKDHALSSPVLTGRRVVHEFRFLSFFGGLRVLDVGALFTD